MAYKTGTQLPILDLLKRIRSRTELWGRGERNTDHADDHWRANDAFVLCKINLKCRIPGLATYTVVHLSRLTHTFLRNPDIYQIVSTPKKIEWLLHE